MMQRKDERSGRHRLVNRVVTITWILLILVVLGLYLRERLGGVRELIEKLRRQPRTLAQNTVSREMAGFTCDFEQQSDLEIWTTNNTRIQIVPSPLGTGGRWARVTYYRTITPGLLWTEDEMGMMDWRPAKVFSFTAYNPQARVVNLKVKVKDEEDHIYQKDITLPGGTVQTVEIPIQQVAKRVDASRVNYLNLFLWEPPTETILFYDHFCLSAVSSPPPPSGLVHFAGLEFPVVVRGGEEVNGSFYFILRRPIKVDHLLLIRFRKGETIYPLARVAPPFPTSKWLAEKLTKVGPVPIAIPAELAPGNYALEVILARPHPDRAGLEYFFQPYDNPDISGYTVSKIKVTKPRQ